MIMESENEGYQLKVIEQGERTSSDGTIEIIVTTEQAVDITSKEVTEAVNVTPTVKENGTETKVAEGVESNLELERSTAAVVNSSLKEAKQVADVVGVEKVGEEANKLENLGDSKTDPNSNVGIFDAGALEKNNCIVTDVGVNKNGSEVESTGGLDQIAAIRTNNEEVKVELKVSSLEVEGSKLEELKQKRKMLAEKSDRHLEKRQRKSESECSGRIEDTITLVLPVIPQAKSLDGSPGQPNMIDEVNLDMKKVNGAHADVEEKNVEKATVEEELNEEIDVEN